MVILINAISSKEGGALVVLQYMLKDFIRLRPDIKWNVVINNQVAIDFDMQGVCVYKFPFAEISPFHVLWWYNSTLPKLVETLEVDVLFSMTNLLPNRNLACSTLLLEQQAGHFSDKFNTLMKAHCGYIEWLIWCAKESWVVNSLKKASLVTVQTSALAAAIVKCTGISKDKIKVVAHGPGLGAAREITRKYGDVGKIWQIGYVAKFGVQKNFDVLFEAVALLIQNGKKIVLHITLDPTLSECQSLLVRAYALGLKDTLRNHGELSAIQIQELYSQLDIFVFPSLCESFGLPLVEAMAQGIPTLASDIDSNIELLGGARYTFPSGDSNYLAKRIAEVMRAGCYEEASAWCLDRTKEFSWERAASDTLNLMIGLVKVDHEIFKS